MSLLFWAGCSQQAAKRNRRFDVDQTWIKVHQPGYEMSQGEIEVSLIVVPMRDQKVQQCKRRCAPMFGGHLLCGPYCTCLAVVATVLIKFSPSDIVCVVVVVSSSLRIFLCAFLFFVPSAARSSGRRPGAARANGSHFTTGCIWHVVPRGVVGQSQLRLYPPSHP